MAPHFKLGRTFSNNVLPLQSFAASGELGENIYQDLPAVSIKIGYDVFDSLQLGLVWRLLLPSDENEINERYF